MIQANLDNAIILFLVLVGISVESILKSTDRCCKNFNIDISHDHDSILE